MSSYEVVCLADHPHLLDSCVDLLNNQWRRSRTARVRCLEQAKQYGLPTSLLLLQTTSPYLTEVIGHCMVSPVPHQDSSCFVSSVVITPSKRGLGLGRLIMEEMEAFVKREGIKVVHLTTYDQQGFYEKLGYQLSDPVIMYGGISQNLKKLMENNDHGPAVLDTPVSNEVAGSKVNRPETGKSSSIPHGPPPPPPPPPPPIPQNVKNSELRVVHMAKVL